MKKYIIIFSILVVVSCNDGFLDKQPLETASISSLFASATDVELAVNGIYDVMQGDIWGGSFFYLPPHLDAISENATFCCSWEGGFQTIAQGGHSPTTGGVINYKWNFGYKGIARANAVLANINRTDISIADNIRKSLSAESRFLRGLYYFELTNYFGGVPLLLKPVDRSESKVARNSKDEVIKAVLEDLDFAIANLDAKPYKGQFGRATKLSAMGLKVKVLLHNKRYAEAAAAGKALIDLENSGVVGLVNDYESLFSNKSKNNKEVLFDIQFKAGKTGEGNSLSTCYGPADFATGGGWGSLTYLAAMFDDYYMKDGLPISKSPLYKSSTPWANRDPRLEWSFFVPGVSKWLGKTYTKENYNGSNPDYPLVPKKWAVETDVNFDLDGDANFILIRYADVLLMYAEAQNEAVGADASVYAAINKVRARAKMPNVTAGMNQAQMRDEIRHERKIEFTQEGLWYLDIVRWGIAEKLINSTGDKEKRSWKASTNSLFPIPQSEIDANPSLKQNLGY